MEQVSGQNPSGALETLQSAPKAVKDLFKVIQKTSIADAASLYGIIDLASLTAASSDVQLINPDLYLHTSVENVPSDEESRDAFTIPGFEGLRILPGLVNHEDQEALLNTLLHENLANPMHKTNVDFHHHIPYRLCHGIPAVSSVSPEFKGSFFSVPRSSASQFMPLNDKTHCPFTISDFLDHKLRWMTLGGQYDWTLKQYPEGPHPEFPQQIASLCRKHFPTVMPEAAIANVYRPGDTLAMHRDISESSDNALISMSLGCDGIFIIALENKEDHNLHVAALRLHSGDALYLSRRSRSAWHGLAKVLPHTTPDLLKSWPVLSSGFNSREEYEQWRGWLHNRRVNLSIRQISP